MIKTENKTAQQTTEHAIVITRIVDAPPDAVFDAWIQPWRVMKWFSPKGFTSPFFAIDLRAGGICRHCMRSPEGKDFWSQGVFREIRKPHRLVYTDSFCDENGNIVSPKQYGLKDWPNETIITVTFDDYAGGTKLTLMHWPVKPSKERDMCQQGWNECLDKLTDYLAKEKKI
jgi:uncharacterized protein YndB with AHSA1/START domain